MTVDQMRAIIGAGPEISDADVIVRYGGYTSNMGAQGLDLASVRDHLRLSSDTVEENSYLELLIAAARSSVESYIQRPVQFNTDEKNVSVVKVAMLLLIGHWYANREAVVIGTPKSEMPMAVTYLLMPLKKWVC
jgi:hypothetical protein